VGHAANRALTKFKLTSPPQSSVSWQELFAAHPEFFGRSTDYSEPHYFLTMRIGYPRTIHVATRQPLPPEKLAQINSREEKNTAGLVRRELSPDQVTALMKSAIDLHAHVVALADRRRWWITTLMPLLISLIGVRGTLLATLTKTVR
jgi:hypothetical protein